MNKYKVCVYAICKNESKFVKTWMNSMSEADEIYVLDTGSTDNTVELLKEMGAKVTVEVITPWRFDTARNKSLELVPQDADICVCTDLDEEFEAGWRKRMEQVWNNGATSLKYRYTWNFNPDGTEGTVFWISKVHKRTGFKWVNPVHEVLKYSGEEPFKEVEVSGVQLNHHADNSKSRSQYLKLLELAVEEDPNNDRNRHYLGREYMFNGMWKECEETLKHHLIMPNATWRDERCASMRYLAKAAYFLGKYDEEQQWIYMAISEAGYMREPWLDASEIAARKKEWAGSLHFAQKALEIKERSKCYINDSASWGLRPYDLAALASYYLGLYKLALEYGKKALEYEPENIRLKDNMKYYLEAVKTKNI